jgi:hypothetical protein
MITKKLMLNKSKTDENTNDGNIKDILLILLDGKNEDEEVNTNIMAATTSTNMNFTNDKKNQLNINYLRAISDNQHTNI